MAALHRSLVLLCVLVLTAALSACSGRATSSLPPSTTHVGTTTTPVTNERQALDTSVKVALTGARQTITLPLSGGFSGTLTVHANNPPPGTTITVGTTNAACPTIPTVTIENAFPFSIRLDVEELHLNLPCDVNGALFGLSFFQIKPVPATVAAIKVSDATASGTTLVFRPQAEELTLATQSISDLVTAREQTTASVTLPVVPGVITQLTSNVSNVPSTLSFSYEKASGASMFGSACLLAHDANGTLAPALQGIPLVGTPSFFCHLDPGDSTITFGQLVKFFISAPQPDASILGLDGPTRTFLCAPGTTQQCNTPAFSIPEVKNVVVGNVRDLKLCVPLEANTDCNDVNEMKPAPAATNLVPFGHSFQLLVADDPTYKPGTPTAPVPWDGLFRIHFSGPCELRRSPDNNNGDVPPSPFPGQPGYSDADQTGIGPYAEFDIRPNARGICAITVSEDPAYITDDSNPANPTGRSASLTVTIR